jgi:hypothetical protein
MAADSTSSTTDTTSQSNTMLDAISTAIDITNDNIVYSAACAMVTVLPVVAVVSNQGGVSDNVINVPTTAVVEWLLVLLLLMMLLLLTV